MGHLATTYLSESVSALMVATMAFMLSAVFRNSSLAVGFSILCAIHILSQVDISKQYILCPVKFRCNKCSCNRTGNQQEDGKTNRKRAVSEYRRQHKRNDSAAQSFSNFDVQIYYSSPVWAPVAVDFIYRFYFIRVDLLRDGW